MGAGDPAPARALVRARLQARAARLAADGSPSLQRDRLAGRRAPSALRAIVLMCDFSDSLLYGRYGTVPGDFPPPRQTEFYYAAHDSLYFAHVMQDLAAYYDAVSGGRFAWDWTVEARVANLPHPMRWYGDDPELGDRPTALAADVVAALDDVVDFSLYDTVVLVHAGAGEETDILDDSPEQIYSTYLGPEDFARAHEDSLLDQPYLPSDDFPAGEGIRQVLVLPETEYQDPIQGIGGYFGSLGVYCFEVGLRLGMLSLSDFTPAGSPDSQGIGEYGLMGYGLFVGAGLIPDHPCAYNKLLMGWLDPYEADPAVAATWRLTPAESPGGPLAAARIEISGREFWLLEYRRQDPNGDMVFSWADDRNGDGIPNFTRRDDPTFVPQAFRDFFDPAVDVRETLAGAEWDFFMSENTARPEGVKGAGSGIYIWHVDEGVIRAAFGAETTLFNADPSRKSVDLEEADGIQDLDSRQGSPYVLGSDLDSFRGEGSRPFGETPVVGTVFGVDTRPATTSAGGAWTGFVVDGFSDVVVDSTHVVTDAQGDERIVVLYADTMSFRLSRRASPTAAVLAAEVTIPDADLAGSHLLAVDLDVPRDGRREIVAAAAGGAVYALEPDLREHVDRDGDPATLMPLAVALAPDGSAPAWCGPPAAGDLDGDGAPEIVLSARDGLYAVRGEGGPLAGPEPAGWRLAVLAGCRLPAVLLPRHEGAAPDDAAAPVVACVVEDEPGGAYRARFLDGAGADAYPALDLPCRPETAPLLVARTLVFPGSGADGGGLLHLARWEPEAGGAVALGEIPLAVAPSGLDPLAGDRGEGTCLVVPGVEATETVCWEGAPAVMGATATVWPAGTVLASAPAPGIAFLAGGGFDLVGSGGAPATGWPVTPRPAAGAAAAGRAPSPLRLPEADGASYLFSGDDGRLWLTDQEGRVRSGWPLAGPADAAGTPLLTDLDADGVTDLVAVGAFERIVGSEGGGGPLLGRPLSRLAVWRDVGGSAKAGGAAWPMWRGGPWRTGAVTSLLEPVAAAGGGLLAEGPICYPNPLRQDLLRVRGVLRRDARVRLWVYNLEGEEVAAAGPASCVGGEVFELPVSLPGVASGLYLCRISAVAGDGRAEATAPFAIVR